MSNAEGIEIFHKRHIEDLTGVLMFYWRTLDSLNEGLPMKMAREIFKENDSRFKSWIIRKSVFLIGQVPINIVFAI